MKLNQIAALLGICTAAWASAQTESPSPQPQDSEPAKPAASQAQRGESRFDRSRLNRIRAELRLDERQKGEFNEVLERFARADDERDVRRSIRKVLSELRAARKAQDESRLEEQHAELRRLSQDQLLAFLYEIESFLNPGQANRLVRIRTRLRTDNPKGFSSQVESIARLRTDLDLRDEQKKTFDGQVAAFVKNLDPSLKTRDLSQEQIDELLKALQEALESGDESKVRALRERVVARRPDPDLAMAEFVSAVDYELTGAQRPILEDFVLALTSRREESSAHDTRDFLRAARRCDLTEQQKARLKEIEQAARKSADRRNPLRLALGTYTFRAQLEEMLDDQQRTKFREIIDASAPDDQDNKPGVKRRKRAARKKTGERPEQPEQPDDSEPRPTPD